MPNLLHVTDQPCLLFDWGDTLMRVFPEYRGPMCAWPRVEAIPGARETLAQLSPTFRLALATNAADSGEAEIRAALARVGLDALLEKIYCQRRVHQRKPSKEFFDFIFKDLQIVADQVIMVGDNFEADILGANQCGIRAIWYAVQHGENRQSATIQTIHSLSELPNRLTIYFPAG
ncbi:MAG: hypothetical protein AUK01_01925 [Anaerolineae bacterium CG2_30_57_67]|nr:MAG: hypothetical protein AUK01_01925 [Anaerolineae bacterium CG2_30_57_67]